MHAVFAARDIGGSDEGPTTINSTDLRSHIFLVRVDRTRAAANDPLITGTFDPDEPTVTGLRWEHYLFKC
jgi:hypothetical protein